MSDRDFTIGVRKFKLNKLDVFVQFHLLRRLTPILSDLIPLSTKLSKLKDTDSAQMEALIPVMNGIAKLSDEDANRVLLGLLSSVEMQQSQGNWAKVANDNGLMFHDLDLPLLMQIAGRAFAFNLQGFLGGNPQLSQARG